MPSPSTVNIRPATADDAAVMISLLKELAAHDGHESQCRMTEEDIITFGFGERAHFEAAIAEVDGVPAGMALYFFTFTTWGAAPVLFMNDLVVGAGFRGRGVGKRLIAHLARIATERNCAWMDWNVLDHAEAVNFYRASGAREVDAFRVYRLEGEQLTTIAGHQTA